MERPGTSRIGLALGGGTARGMAHVGALKALEAAGRRPVALAGSSFGAIIAAMAAMGTPAAAIERTVREVDLRALWAQALDFGAHRAALVEGGRLARWLDRTIFRGARFEDLETPLAVAATDLRTGEAVVLREGHVADAVRASCALPGVFAPVATGARVLVDGGFVEAVPFGALAHLDGAHRLGIHAGLDLAGSRALRRLRAFDGGRGGRALHAAAAAARGDGAWTRLLLGLSLSLRSYRVAPRAPAGATLVTVDPGIAWWDFHRAPLAIEAGERAMRRWLLSGASAPGTGDAPAEAVRATGAALGPVGPLAARAMGEEEPA